MNKEVRMPGRVPATIAVLTLAIGGSASKQAIEPTSAFAAQTCTTETYDAQIPDPLTGGTMTIQAERTVCKEGQNATETTPADTNQSPEPAKTPAVTHHKSSKAKRQTQRRSSSTRKFVSFEMANWAQTKGDGCASASFAMVASSIGKRRVTPNEVATSEQIKPVFTHAGGVRGFVPTVFPKLARHYGLESKKVGFNDAERTLKHGGLVIMLAQAGHFAGGSGHFMVGKDAKNGKIIISDPNGKGKSGDSERKNGWGPRELKSNGVIGYWAFNVR